MPIVINNVCTFNDLSSFHSREEMHLYSLSTRVYWDCWSAYSEEEFKNKGYILH